MGSKIGHQRSGLKSRRIIPQFIPHGLLRQDGVSSSEIGASGSRMSMLNKPRPGLLIAITTGERERERQGMQKLQGSDQMIQRGGLDPMMTPVMTPMTPNDRRESNDDG